MTDYTKKNDHVVKNDPKNDYNTSHYGKTPTPPVTKPPPVVKKDDVVVKDDLIVKDDQSLPLNEREVLSQTTLDPPKVNANFVSPKHTIKEATPEEVASVQDKFVGVQKTFVPQSRASKKEKPVDPKTVKA